MIVRILKNSSVDFFNRLFNCLAAAAILTPASRSSINWSCLGVNCGLGWSFCIIPGHIICLEPATYIPLRVTSCPVRAFPEADPRRSPPYQNTRNKRGKGKEKVSVSVILFSRSCYCPYAHYTSNSDPLARLASTRRGELVDLVLDLWQLLPDIDNLS